MALQPPQDEGVARGGLDRLPLRVRGRRVDGVGPRGGNPRALHLLPDGRAYALAKQGPVRALKDITRTTIHVTLIHSDELEVLSNEVAGLHPVGVRIRLRLTPVFRFAHFGSVSPHVFRFRYAM